MRGCGKTRLAFEFAAKIADAWSVYFVRYYPQFIKADFDDKTLLIVDDAVREQIPLEGIVRLGANVKVIVLDRSYNIDSIRAKLGERADYEVVSLEREDVYKLLENLGIEGEVKEKIFKKSGGIFFYALLLAEDYKKKKVVDLEEALESRVWKYIDEISENLGIDAGEAKRSAINFPDNACKRGRSGCFW